MITRAAVLMSLFLWVRQCIVWHNNTHSAFEFVLWIVCTFWLAYWWWLYDTERKDNK